MGHTILVEWHLTIKAACARSHPSYFSSAPSPLQFYVIRQANRGICLDFACGFSEQVRVPKTLMFSMDSAKEKSCRSHLDRENTLCACSSGLPVLLSKGESSLLIKSELTDCLSMCRNTHYCFSQSTLYFYFFKLHCVCVSTPLNTCDARVQFGGVDSLLPLCGSWGSNSGPVTWQQVPFLLE